MREDRSSSAPAVRAATALVLAVSVAGGAGCVESRPAVAPSTSTEGAAGSAPGPWSAAVRRCLWDATEKLDLPPPEDEPPLYVVAYPVRERDDPDTWRTRVESARALIGPYRRGWGRVASVDFDEAMRVVTVLADGAGHASAVIHLGGCADPPPPYPDRQIAALALRFASAQAAAAAARAHAPMDVRIVADEPTNALVVTGPPAEVRRVRVLVAALDCLAVRSAAIEVCGSGDGGLSSRCAPRNRP